MQIIRLNQADHRFKPSFFIWCYIFQEKRPADHKFKPGLTAQPPEVARSRAPKPDSSPKEDVESTQFRLVSGKTRRCSYYMSYYCAQGAEGIFGEIFLVKNLEHNSGSQFMVRSGLSLSQHSLAWHDFDPAFRSFGPSPPEWLLSPSAPPQPPPSPRRLWPGQAGQSLTSPSCLPSPSPEGPQSMVNFSGDFLGEILALPSKCFGTPQKNPCKNPCNICTNNSCKQSVQKSAQKKSGKKPCKKSVQKSVQKIRAKNPCRKSVQKIRAENPCRKSVQKICAKQTRANGFPKVTLQIEKPKIL